MATKPRPTVQQLYLVCATALVAMPTAKKYFDGRAPMRPAMVQRIETALRQLGLEHLRPRRSTQK